MISKDHILETFVMTCDSCSEELSLSGSSSFSALVDYAKEKRWSIRQDDDAHWHHTCPTCKPSSVEEQRRLLGL